MDKARTILRIMSNGGRKNLGSREACKDPHWLDSFPFPFSFPAMRIIIPPTAVEFGSPSAASTTATNGPFRSNLLVVSTLSSTSLGVSSHDNNEENL